jgi:hypothetical protein
MTRKTRLRFDDLGKDPQGNKITAATDSAGPQVIVKGKNVHLLSKPLKDHEEAVALGSRVVMEGAKCYDEWFDLEKGGTAMSLFAVFGGCFRGGHIDKERLL